MDDIHIGYLCDHPEAIPVIGEALRAESPGFFRGWSADDVVERIVRPTLRRDGLPLALVALAGGAVAGTAALRHDSITTHPHLGPWLAALHVLPAHRRRGIGAALIRAVEREAARLGIGRLYAGSGAAAPLFERLGWQAIERTTYHGEPLAILRREVLDAGAP